MAEVHLDVPRGNARVNLQNKIKFCMQLGLMTDIPNDIEPPLVGWFRTSGYEDGLPPSSLANQIKKRLGNTNESLNTSIAQVSFWNI